MSTISNNMNLNQHYSTNAKVEKPKPVIVSGPQSLPSRHTFDDKLANIKIAEVNKELNEKSKIEKNKSVRNFAKVFAGIVITILAALGIKRILK